MNELTEHLNFANFPGEMLYACLSADRLSPSVFPFPERHQGSERSACVPHLKSCTYKMQRMQHDNMNRLLEYDQYTYSYDANGNLISKTSTLTSASTFYYYDSENRLIQVVTPSNIVLYQYDGLGRRIAKTVNGVVTKYVYDGEDVLLELDENEQITVRYTRTLAIDELISVDRDTDGNGTLDTTYYYHRDGLGSVIVMTNSSGTIVQSYVYDAFGKIVQQTGSIENRYTYTSREWDSEAGLYYYRARFYSPEIGRFLQEDPIGFDGGINFYVYNLNNPVNLLDPLGLCGCEEKVFNWDKFFICLSNKGVRIITYGVACAIAIKIRVHPAAKVVAIIGACGLTAGLIIDCLYKAYECKK